MCLALGYPHPDFLLRELTAEQWAEWEAYAQVEPVGFPIDNFRFGQICAAVANFSFGSKKRNFVPDDFMPKREDLTKVPAPPTKQVSNKLLEFFKGLVKMRS